MSSTKHSEANYCDVTSQLSAGKAWAFALLSSAVDNIIKMELFLSAAMLLAYTAAFLMMLRRQKRTKF